LLYPSGGEGFALLIWLLGLPITNHFSPITSHGRASGLAVRLQDFFLILSQCVDLGLLAVTAAFRAAGDFEKILGSGFEIVRISQCESPRVFRIGPEWREAALQEREAKLLDIESRLKLAALMPEARVALPAVGNRS